MSGSAESRNHQPRGTHAHDVPWHHDCALSRARPGYLCFSLTVDSHGCRQSGHLGPRPPPGSAKSELPVTGSFTAPPAPRT